MSDEPVNCIPFLFHRPIYLSVICVIRPTTCHCILDIQLKATPERLFLYFHRSIFTLMWQIATCGIGVWQNDAFWSYVYLITDRTVTTIFPFSRVLGMWLVQVRLSYLAWLQITTYGNIALSELILIISTNYINQISLTFLAFDMVCYRCHNLSYSLQIKGGGCFCHKDTLEAIVWAVVIIK